MRMEKEGLGVSYWVYCLHRLWFGRGPSLQSTSFFGLPGVGLENHTLDHRPLVIDRSGCISK